MRCSDRLLLLRRRICLVLIALQFLWSPVLSCDDNGAGRKLDVDDEACCLCESCEDPLFSRLDLIVDARGATCNDIFLEMRDPCNESNMRTSRGRTMCNDLIQAHRQLCCDATYEPPVIVETEAPSPMVNPTAPTRTLSLSPTFQPSESPSHLAEMHSSSTPQVDLDVIALPLAGFCCILGCGLWSFQQKSKRQRTSVTVATEESSRSLDLSVIDEEVGLSGLDRQGEENSMVQRTDSPVADVETTRPQEEASIPITEVDTQEDPGSAVSTDEETTLEPDQSSSISDMNHQEDDARNEIAEPTLLYTLTTDPEAVRRQKNIIHMTGEDASHSCNERHQTSYDLVWGTLGQGGADVPRDEREVTAEEGIPVTSTGSANDACSQENHSELPCGERELEESGGTTRRNDTLPVAEVAPISPAMERNIRPLPSLDFNKAHTVVKRVTTENGDGSVIIREERLNNDGEFATVTLKYSPGPAPFDSDGSSAG